MVGLHLSLIQLQNADNHSQNSSPSKEIQEQEEYEDQNNGHFDETNHNEDYEEGDVDPDLDDNFNQQESVSLKFVDSRQARKRAEEDSKLLANRIALLKMEEKKVSHTSVLTPFVYRRGKRLKRPRTRPETLCM